jgi:outer membrane murein-binding lipoprotein Lpp
MSKTLQYAVAIVVAVLVAVVIGGGLALRGDNDGLSGQVSAQTAQIRALTAQEQALKTQEQALKSEYISLSSQVSGLNQPSDPLSAYNDICQVPLQNQGTGATQTYYYPCTNVAQTTPEPGN